MVEPRGDGGFGQSGSSGIRKKGGNPGTTGHGN